MKKISIWILGILVTLFIIGFLSRGNTKLSNNNSDDCDHVNITGVGSIMKDNCYVNLALKKLDKSLCEKIEDKNTKPNCLVMFENNNSLCNQVNEEMKPICYLNYAISKKDISSCLDISNKSIKFSCYKAIAILNKDQAICQKITGNSYDDSLRYSCLALVTEDEKNCEDEKSALGEANNEFGSTYSDSCYAELSLKISNKSICEKINNSQIKSLCLNPDQKIDVNPDLFR